MKDIKSVEAKPDKTVGAAKSSSNPDLCPCGRSQRFCGPCPPR